MENINPEIINSEQESSRTIESILKRAKELGSELNELYDDFHSNPELGGQEIETAKKIKDYLEKLGIEIVGDHIGKGPVIEETDKKVIREPGTSVVAIIRGNEGPAIALRADMDALPIQENKEHEVCSNKDGVAHLCGHDAHITGLLGGATILKEIADKGELDGDVILMFQSSEEKTHQKESGAVQIVKFLEEKGLRDRIKAFMGLHVYANTERGNIMLNDPREKGGDVQTASSGEIDITVSGPGGHILNVFEKPDIDIIMGRIKERVEDSFKHLHDEGTALVASSEVTTSPSGYNVLVEKGKRTFVIRVASQEYKEMTKDIEQNIRQIVADIVKEEVLVKSEAAKNRDKSEVKLEDIKVDIKVRRGYRPSIHRDAELVDIANNVSKDVLNNSVGNYERDSKQLDKKRFFGGEDFSFYLEKFREKEIPGVFVMVGAANSEKGIKPNAHHSSNFKIDTDVNQDLAAIHAGFAVNTLKYLKEKE